VLGLSAVFWAAARQVAYCRCRRRRQLYRHRSFVRPRTRPPDANPRDELACKTCGSYSPGSAPAAAGRTSAAALGRSSLIWHLDRRRRCDPLDDPAVVVDLTGIGACARRQRGLRVAHDHIEAEAGKKMTVACQYSTSFPGLLRLIGKVAANPLRRVSAGVLIGQVRSAPELVWRQTSRPRSGRSDSRQGEAAALLVTQQEHPEGKRRNALATLLVNSIGPATGAPPTVQPSHRCHPAIAALDGGRRPC